MEKILKKLYFDRPTMRKLGHYTKSNYSSAFVVVASNGIVPIIMENHGAVLATVVRKKGCNNEL